MLPELQMVWKQFQETSEALRVAIGVLPDDRLSWLPTPGATCAARIVQHIARANEFYASHMEGNPRRSEWPIEDTAPRALLLERLENSESRVRTCLEGMSAEDLHKERADGWGPLSGPEVAGPLDSLWFAHQMVRHTAYHLGQVNYIHLLLGL